MDKPAIPKSLREAIINGLIETEVPYTLKQSEIVRHHITDYINNVFSPAFMQITDKQLLSKLKIIHDRLTKIAAY